jgi:hypothetical protein
MGQAYVHFSGLLCGLADTSDKLRSSVILIHSNDVLRLQLLRRSVLRKPFPETSEERV